MSRVLKVQRSDPQRAIHSKPFFIPIGNLDYGRSNEPRPGTAARGGPERYRQTGDERNAPKTISGKAFGILGLPDTVNEARVRSLVPENLAIEKVEMRPENEGAILVFQREAVQLPISSVDVLGCRSSCPGD
jgi:Occluded RNA-recognition motif